MAQPELVKPERWPLRGAASGTSGVELGRRLPRGPSTGFLDRIARPRLRPYAGGGAVLRDPRGEL